MIGHSRPRAQLVYRRAHRRLGVALALLPALAGALSLARPPSPAHAAGLSPTWTQLNPAASPAARSDASIAYDPATRQLILFGGADDSSVSDLSDTWSWDGSDWQQLNPATSPPALQDAGMAYDAATHQLILFGGYGRQGATNGTWSWDGSTWTQLNPAAGPPARSAATMSYDQISRRLILFGGASSTNAALGDTWSWDGATWTQLSPALSPPAREFAGMDFDPASGQIVLFGGADGDVRGQLPNNLGDTWGWTGSTWHKFAPANSPSARYGAEMTYDPATGQMLLFGLGNLSREVWSWNGSTWSQVSSFGPSAREGANVDYDPATGQIVFFGGFGVTGITSPLDYLADTWTYTIPAAPPTWSQLSAAGPPAQVGGSTAYDPATGQLILFAPSNGAVGDTWNWDGSTWHQLSPSSSPPARESAGMAYDPATRQLLLFGGFGSGGYLADTWSWDGSTWHQLNPAASPPARSRAAMAYDPASGQIVLFGGEDLTDYAMADMWGWNGSNWHQLSPAASPHGRRLAGMAYDPASGQLILFGGDNGPLLADTWSWDGSTWRQLSPAASPPARENAGLAYDPANGQLLLFGGGGTDTWSWDGSTWHQFSPAASPPAREGAGLAYDPANGQVVLFGGEDNTSNRLGDTWGWASGPSMPIHAQVTNGPASVTADANATLAFTASGGAGALTTTCALDTPSGAGSPGPCASSTGATYSNLTASGAYRFTVTATDALGDSGSATYSWTVDAAPPVISPIDYLGTPLNPNPFDPLGGSYLLGATQPVEFTCSDAYDQITSCGGSVTGTGISGATVVNNGDMLPTNTAGTFTLTVSARDQAGNTAQRQVGYAVSNPPPSLSSTRLVSPQSAVAGSAGVTIKIFGARFVTNVSQVEWNGSALSGATYYAGGSPVSAPGGLADEIDVPVPAADLTTVSANQVTVVTPGPGGGATSPALFYVTPAGVSVTASAEGTSNAASGIADAQTATLVAAGSGKGSVAIAQYSGDPEATTPTTPVNAYFDVFVPAGSSFSALTVQDCNLGGGSMVYYWTGSAWAPVAGQSYDAGGLCVHFTLTNTSTPSILQLSGTPFGVENVPPVVADPGAQSVRYGQSFSFNLTATDAEPGDTVTLAATGLPAGLSLGPTTFNPATQQWTATVSGSAPAGAYTAMVTANDGTSTTTPLSVPVTVTRAPLTITANDKQMLYGMSVPAFDAHFDGLVNGEGSGVVTGLSCTATDGHGNPVRSTTPAGAYPIICSGASAANYAITYQPGTLTITLFTNGSLLALSQDGATCHLLLNSGATATATGGVAVNGASSSALCLNSATLSGTTISVQGGVKNNNGTVHGTLLTHQAATANLLATLQAPSAPSAPAAVCPGAACPDGTTLDAGHPNRLLPGAYTQPITANSGATVCVAPGVYVLKASWTLNSARLQPYGSAGCPALPSGTTDPGVLLYFAQGHVVPNGSGHLTQLRAMQSGPYAGLLYWQADGESTSLNGSGGFAGGAWYEPNGTLILNGSTHLTAPYVAAATITVSGGTSLTVTGS